MAFNGILIPSSLALLFGGTREPLILRKLLFFRLVLFWASGRRPFASFGEARNFESPLEARAAEVVCFPLSRLGKGMIGGEASRANTCFSLFGIVLKAFP